MFDILCVHDADKLKAAFTVNNMLYVLVFYIRHVVVITFLFYACYSILNVLYLIPFILDLMFFCDVETTFDVISDHVKHFELHFNV